ncbi:MAG: tRNA pseudouridine(38-40) synthase TruA [Streptococcaceae bacterium]|jgi:tRNA pseudouridine38-40 synthase|nr:tRNA pseudouridine(38-40) synthase TruA [Streptococcaceae bacterium]
MNHTRYKAIIAYDGTLFHGFQRQNNVRSVQACLEKTLTKLNSGHPVIVQGSGRTDAFVHALGQVIHFDLETNRDCEKLRFALDTQSDEDIAIISIEKVSNDWHARYNPHQKTYLFKLDIGKPRSPFNRNYSSYFPYPLDVKLMQEAIQYLIGTHDFTGFTATGGSVEDKVRTIYRAEIYEYNNQIHFLFEGNGFLYKQIRNMVGTLIKIGNQRMPVEQITKILITKDRSLAGPTAHPEGLYLKEVKYLS